MSGHRAFIVLHVIRETVSVLAGRAGPAGPSARKCRGRSSKFKVGAGAARACRCGDHRRRLHRAGGGAPTGAGGRIGSGARAGTYRLGRQLTQRRTGSHRPQTRRRDAHRPLWRGGRAGAVRRVDRGDRALERLVADEGLECEYERSGHIDAANKPSHFKAFREEQALLRRVFNHRVELVPAPEQHAEIGSDAYHGLMLDERSGALNPARYAEQLAAAASRAGAMIVEGAGVTALSRQQKTWTVTTQPRVRWPPATCWRRPTAIPTVPFPGCSGDWCRSAATSSPPSR